MWLIRMRMYLAFVLLLLDPTRYISAVNLNVQFCGFEQKCAGNATYGDQTKDSCCQPCECADVCKERDTCCVDKEGRDDNEKIIKQQCLPAIYMPEGIQESSGIQSFYTRDRCPKAFNDLRIKEKCENEMSSESLEDITYASSEDGTIVYKNKFCGLCHDEKGTIPWKVSVSRRCLAMVIEKVTTLSAFTPSLLVHCSISFRKPENLVLKHTVCFDRALIISQCNQTGSWDVYDSKLEESCRRPLESFNYYKIMPNRYIVYRNVYCYLCNTKANTDPEICEQLNFRLSAQNSFSSLILHTTLTSPADQKKISNKCKADQILDTFFNVCRRLYCPMFFLASNGQCQPFMNPTFNYPLKVTLIPLEPLNKTESIKRELMSCYTSLVRKLGFGGCELCSARIYLKRDANETLISGVYVRFAFGVAERCKPEYIVSKLTSLEMAAINIKLSLKKKSVSFNSVWSTTVIFGRQQFEMIQKVATSPCPTMPEERALNCAKVKLTAEEYQTVLKSHVHASELLFAPNQKEGNGTVFVCCDKYIVNPTSAGVKKRFGVMIAFITLVISSCRYM